MLFCLFKRLAEHGSGYVVYFHFIRVMGIMVLFMAFVMLYPIIYYNSVDSDITCSLTENAFLTSPFPDVTPSIVAGPPLEGIIPTVYQACTCSCDALSSWQCDRNRDQEPKIDPQTGQEYFSCADIETSVLSAIWCTPGNVGYQRIYNTFPPYVIVTFLLFVVVLLAGPHISRLQQSQVADLDADTISPNDYCIQVNGLPKNMIDENEIKEFMETNLCDYKVEVVKVVIAFKILAFHEIQMELKGMVEKRADHLLMGTQAQF